MTRRFATVSRRECLQVGAVAMAGAELVDAGRAMAFGQAQTGGRTDPQLASVKALVFDMFGTVVDWRTSVAREVEELAKRKGLTVDGAKFADAWRAEYGPSMNRVRSGELPWTKLDRLHRMILDKILIDFGSPGFGGRDRCPQSRVASAATVARRRRRTHAAEEEIHHRAALERQYLA